jgi:hypothetical protein
VTAAQFTLTAEGTRHEMLAEGSNLALTKGHRLKPAPLVPNTRSLLISGMLSA